MDGCRRYESGAVGSLMHVVALQGTNYSCELEVFADGHSLRFVHLFFTFPPPSFTNPPSSVTLTLTISFTTTD